MNPKVFISSVILGCALSSANALFGTIAATTAGNSAAITLTALGATAGTTAFLTPAGAVVLGGGALLLKAAAIAAIANDFGGRGKRSTDSNTQTDIMIAAIADNQPDKCYSRLICDLATGTMPKSDGDVILSLFNKDVPADNVRFDFVTAAKIGKQLKNTEFCEYRYSCPLTGAQISKIFA